MTAVSEGFRPRERSWTVAIYVEGLETPKGSGVLVDRRRVLTCRHVVEGRAAAELSVAFPAAIEDPYRDHLGVVGVDAAEHARADVAVLRLAEDAPGDAFPAPLKRPRASDLIGSPWWAFGFNDETGNSAHGAVGEDLTYGWARIDSESRYHLEKGFSGAGLWCTDYGAVVGLVGQALSTTGDGRALTVNAAARVLPRHGLAALADAYRLEDSGAEAAAEWGWQLAADDEGRRHWRPRARGVTHEAEAGWRFRGRRQALSEIVDWLAAGHVPRTPLVVTGSPGVGKSAVLARIVTTADAQVAQGLPADDTALRAPVGSVACAVHAKGKSALDVAREVARAASAEIPQCIEDTATAVRDALAEAGGRRRFTVVVDALDEATTPTEARSIVHDVLRPLAENCADVGVRVLVGTRRHDDAGELIATFGTARNEIDLDHPTYFDLVDLAAYALATLQLSGDPRPESPYLDPEVAQPVAEQVARASVPNFLVAGLLARQHGLHDDTPVEPASIQLPGDHDPVQVALTRYLDRMSGIDGLSPAQVLLPLAYAETPGLDTGLWAAAITALTAVPVDEAALNGFVSGAAANFLIQTSETTASYRLFHQALNDTLIRNQPVVEDQRALTHAFTRHGADLGWADAPPYLWHSLPHHALAGRDIDTVLTDLGYLLYADLTRLIPAAASAQSAPARAIATLLRRTPHAIGQDSAIRLARFAVTDAIDRLDTGIGQLSTPAPYRPAWAQAQPRSDLATLTGHTGWVKAVCAVTVDGRALLASAGDDGTVRVWDPATGRQERELTGHTGRVNAVCAVTVDGRALLASAGERRHGAGVGPGHRPPGTRADRPHRRGQRGVRGHRGRAGAAGLRRRRRHGAGVGPGHRPPGTRADRPHRRGQRGVRGHRGRAGAAGLRRRRRHGAGVGPGHRPPGTRADRPHRLGQRGVRGHRGRAGAAGLRRRRRHGAGVGPGHRPPGTRADRPHRLGQRGVRGHRGRAGAAGLRRRRRHGAGVGPGHRPPGTRADRPHRLGQRGVRGHRGRAGAAGLRRRRRHGAGVGPGHRPPGTRADRPHRLGQRGVRGHRGRAGAAGLRRRRRHGAGVGPGHRPPGTRADRPHRLGQRGVRGHRGRAGAAGLRRRATARCGCGTRPPATRNAS